MAKASKTKCPKGQEDWKNLDNEGPPNAWHVMVDE